MTERMAGHGTTRADRSPGRLGFPPGPAGTAPGMATVLPSPAGDRPPAGAAAPEAAGRRRGGLAARFAAFARRRPVASLAALAGTAQLAGLVGVPFTARATDSWYDQLDTPWFTPPSGAFAPVWTVLYLDMAVAAWLVARADPQAADRATDPAAAGRLAADQEAALRLWALQLAANAAWSPIFFGARAPELALIDIAALLVTLVATMIWFGRVSRLAALLLVPYAAWVGLATALNASIAVNN